MPTVTGTLQDFNLQPLAGFRPELVFTASGAAVFRPRVFVTKPVVVSPTNLGAFTVELAATTLLRPDTWYTLAIRWLDPQGGYTTTDFPEWKIRVPEEGGNLAELAEAEPTDRMTWVGPNPPTGTLARYLWWIDTSSNPPVLYEWSV